ncbi:uncharacterized protein LOC110053950 [Orbicella faveolata]|uniref:uncharacterized protein LOC110053950 n=1 Tax=Orbicella faveolata TaxID=48498 RepID=UPI0009E2522D|nr:uncharacterized protein LOC110053950 [Orbicella faveolata]
MLSVCELNNIANGRANTWKILARQPNIKATYKENGVTAGMLVEFLEGEIYIPIKYHDWKKLGRQFEVKEPEITVTGKENGVLYDVLFHWGQEMSEAFVSLLMLVFFIGYLTGTRFDPPHLLKEEETDGKNQR